MSVTLNGTIYNDSDFAGEGYIAIFPEQVMSDFLAEAGTQIAAIADMQTTSVTPVLIGTGSKAFVLAVDRAYQPGMFVIAADNAAPTTNFMTGQVTAYVSGTKTLTFTVITSNGSGTISNWYVSMAGERGPSGAGVPAIGGGGDALKLIRVNAGASGHEMATPMDARGRYVQKTTAYTLVDGDYISANTNGGAFTLTLPTSPAQGAEVHIVDENGTFATNNLTIGQGGETIMGLSENLIVDVDNTAFGLVYTGTDWRIL